MAARGSRGAIRISVSTHRRQIAVSTCLGRNRRRGSLVRRLARVQQIPHRAPTRPQEAQPRDRHWRGYRRRAACARWRMTDKGEGVRDEWRPPLQYRGRQQRRLTRHAAYVQSTINLADVDNSGMRLMSTSADGRASRKFIIGTRLCQRPAGVPESSAASNSIA